MNLNQFLSLLKQETLIFVSLYVEDENLGDVLISRLMLEKLGQYGLVIFPTESISERVAMRLGLTPKNILLGRKIWFKVLLIPLLLLRRLLGRKSFKFFQPGHAFSVSEQRFRPIAGFRSLVMVKLYHWLRFRHCRIGLSVGPLNEFHQRLECILRPYFHYYSVREDYSMSYLRGIGVQDIGFCPDMAWLLAPVLDESGVRLRDLALLSFRRSVLGSEDDTYDRPNGAFLQYVLGVAQHLQEVRGLRIGISYQVDRDREFSETIKKFLENNAIRIAGSFQAGDEAAAIELYQRAAIVVSNRLHVLLVAYSTGALPLALVGREHSKIIGVLERAGMQNAVIYFDENTLPDSQFWAERLQVAMPLQAQAREKFRKNRELIEGELASICG